jgi:hypothetical protein
MNNSRKRARKNLPAVLLTLLSIIQAIALESLWSKTLLISTQSGLLSATINIGLQVVISFLLIILIWLIYVGSAIRFRWTPTFGDLIFPFLLGLIELLLIQVMRPQTLGAWFVVLAIAWAMLSIFSYNIHRRTRLDTENEDFFRHVLPATMGDHLQKVATVVVGLIFGGWFWLNNSTGWLTTLALVITLVVFVYYLRIVAKFWNMSMHRN